MFEVTCSKITTIVGLTMGLLWCNASMAQAKTCTKDSQSSRLKDDKKVLPEISGIDRSNRFSDLYWVHNDSGSVPKVFGITSSGKILTEITINAPARDWEDLTTGSCNDQTCIYIADFGNNNGSRNEYDLIVLQEPHQLATSYESEAVVFKFRYPKDGRYNAEALAFNQKNRTLYAIRKSTGSTNTLFRFPTTLTDGMVLEEVCNFASIGSGQVTGADISDDGRRFLIRTYKEIFEYESDTVDDASICNNLVSRNSYSDQGYKEGQGEAIAYREDNQSFVTISEGKSPFLFQFDCQ